MLISFTSTGLLHEGQMDTYQIEVYMESTVVGKGYVYILCSSNLKLQVVSLTDSHHC